MKKIKRIVIFFIVALIISVSLNPSAQVRNIANQEEITVDNASAEIKAIFDTDISKLRYEENLSAELGEEVYSNLDGDLYYYGKNGDLKQYISSTDTLNNSISGTDTMDCSIINENDVLNAAENYLSILVNDSSYYSIDVLSYNESTATYDVVFVHKIDHLNTGDIVYLEIDNNLNMIVFCVPRADAFRKLDGMKINTKWAEESAIDSIIQQYGARLVNTQILNVILNTDENDRIGYQIEAEIKLADTQTTLKDFLFIPF